MGLILTNTTDYDSIREALGVTNAVLPDNYITNLTYLQIAEALITRAVARKAVYGVVSVSTIMAYQPTDPLYPDQTFLKSACAYLVASQFGPSSRNAIITSIKDGDLTYNFGTGIAEQWAEQAEANRLKCAYYLTQITNWQYSTSAVLSTGGPTSAGNPAFDTLSGFSPQSPPSS